jgi:hypothetical protein
MTSIFITVKARVGDPDDAIPWFDWILALASLIVGGFVTVVSEHRLRLQCSPSAGSRRANC